MTVRPSVGRINRLITLSNFGEAQDGKHLAISRYVEQSDIVRIRGFQ
jgi:hypothetical protein